MIRQLRTTWVVVGFLVVGVSWFLLHSPSASVGMDDGAYAIAAQRLQEGRWSVPYEADDADPDGLAFSYPNADRGAEGYYPYTRQPAWVVALAAAEAVGGPFGMRLLVLASGAAAVAATGLLARAAGVCDAAPLAAALVALSPLAYNSLQLWAHAPAALFIALAASGACWLVDDGRPGWALAAGVIGSMGASLLRADGALFALAVGVVVVVVGLRSRRARVFVGGSLIGLAAVGGQVASVAWASSILGSTSGARAPASRADGGPSERVLAALQTLVGQEIGSQRALLLALVALLLVAGAVVVARGRDDKAAAVLVAGALILWLVRIGTERDVTETGLLGAWPLAALVLLVPLADRFAAEIRLLGMFCLGGVAVLWTQYDVGGGGNWGGRFLSAGLPVLAVLTAGALERWSHTAGTRGRRLPVLAVALAMTTTVGLLAFDSHHRRKTDRAVSDIESRSPDGWVVTSSFSLPSLAWRTGEDIRWLRVPLANAGGAERLATILRGLDVDEVVAFRLEDEHFAELTGLAADRNDPERPTAVALAR